MGRRRRRLGHKSLEVCMVGALIEIHAGMNYEILVVKYFEYVFALIYKAGGMQMAGLRSAGGCELSRAVASPT